jgi:hypothetical protein
MPYKSEAQRRYFNANRAKLEKQGVDVDEWNKSTGDAKIPEKVGHNKVKAGLRRAVPPANDAHVAVGSRLFSRPSVRKAPPNKEASCRSALTSA